MSYLVEDFPLYLLLRDVERRMGMTDEDAQMSARRELLRTESLEGARNWLAEYFMKHTSFRTLTQPEKNEYVSAAQHAMYLAVGTPFIVGNRGYKLTEV